MPRQPGRALAPKSALPPAPPRSLRTLRRDLRQAETELALVEVKATTQMLQAFQDLQEAGGVVREDPDARAWALTSSGGH